MAFESESNTPQQLIHLGCLREAADRVRGKVGTSAELQGGSSMLPRRQCASVCELPLVFQELQSVLLPPPQFLLRTRIQAPAPQSLHSKALVTPPCHAMHLDSEAKENILRIEQQARAGFRVELGEVESRMRKQQQVAVDTAITNAAPLVAEHLE